MKKTQQIRFNSLYQQHLNALLRQGKSKGAIDAYLGLFAQAKH